jgi:hypothetical protein
MEKATYYAVSNNGEWQHIADEWEDLDEMIGDEVEVGQCEGCGGWERCEEGDAGAEPNDHLHPDRGHCRQTSTTLAERQRVACECGCTWPVEQVIWRCDGSREWITRC